MSHKGYSLEHYVETKFLELTNQNCQDPVIGLDGGLNRSLRIPCSGAMTCLKGDVISKIPQLGKQIMVECKIKRKLSADGEKKMLVKKEWITKLVAEAQAAKMIPVLVFAFKDARQRRVNALFPNEAVPDVVKHLGDPGRWQQQSCWKENRGSVAVFHNKLVEVDPLGHAGIELPWGILTSFEWLLNSIKSRKSV